MKNSLFIITLLVIIGCSKDDPVNKGQPDPINEQFYFTLDGDTIECHTVSCTLSSYRLSIYGNFTGGAIQIEYDPVVNIGEYLIDETYSATTRHITIWHDNDIYSTWGGLLGQEQGHVTLVIEQMSPEHLKGRFQGRFLHELSTENIEGQFLVSRD